jgi:hypothetical protein
MLHFHRPCEEFLAPPEGTGLSLDAYAWGVVIMSSLLMGRAQALLTLANNADTSKSCDSCGEDTRIYGMKPSSLLSNIKEMTAMILPLFGAIVDHTPYRYK